MLNHQHEQKLTTKIPTNAQSFMAEAHTMVNHHGQKLTSSQLKKNTVRTKKISAQGQALQHQNKLRAWSPKTPINEDNNSSKATTSNLLRETLTFPDESTKFHSYSYRKIAMENHAFGGRIVTKNNDTYHAPSRTQHLGVYQIANQRKHICIAIVVSE